MKHGSRRRLVSLVLVELILCLGIMACSRSAFYRKDDDSYREDSNGTYYSDPGISNPVKKVEAMGQPKKRIVVVNFWNDTPVRLESLGPFAAEEIRRSLFESQKIMVPTDLKSQYNTEDFIQGSGGGQIKVAQLIREGRRLGVSVLLIGRIKKIVFRQKGGEIGLFRQKESRVAVELEVKLFDVQGGREILASTKSAETSSSSLAILDGDDSTSPEFREELSKTAIKQAIEGFTPEILASVEKINWRGKITSVMGSRVYINAGKASGLNIGDIVRVLSPGEDIPDPDTNIILGRAKGKQKGTVEIVDFIGSDSAAAQVHLGGNFQPRDEVELY